MIKESITGLHEIENASRDEITALQLDRMRSSLRHVYDNVAHYRRKCLEADVHPDDLKQLSDLSQFPFTTKDDLRQTYPFGMFAIPREEVVRIHASSGTTGKPTVVGYSKRDIETWAEVVARSIYASGGRPGDIVQVAYGYGLFTGGLGAHYGAEKLGCTVIPISGGQTEKQVQLIRDFTPDIIMVTPTYMLNILDEMESQGINPIENSLKTGIFGAEPWTGDMRGEIERRAGIDAIDIYGLSEVIGPGVANECQESKDGLHIWEDHFFPEIIDPDSGEPVPDGEWGELVFTTLTKEAMPVIRYRTRDLTRLLPGTARTMRRMEKITGRSDDMLIIRGINLFPSQIEELVFQDKRLAPHYQLEVSRDGSLDRLQIHVELRPNCRDDSASSDSARILQRHVKSLIGLSCQVKVHHEGGVERSAGKARRVIDHRR